MPSLEKPWAGWLALLLLPLVVVLLEWIFQAHTAGGALLRVLLFVAGAALLRAALVKNATSTTRRMPASEYGATVLQCRLSPANPAIWIVVAAVLILEAGVELRGHARPNAWPEGTTLIVLDLALALAFVVMAIRQLSNPTVLFEVTDRGVVLNNFGNSLVRDELFLPWERVLEVKAPQQMYAGETGVGRVLGPWKYCVIALKVRRDGDWPPQGSLQCAPEAKVEDAVYLDAEGRPGGIGLFRELEVLRGKYAGT